jgi:hypothetical protein
MALNGIINAGTPVRIITTADLPVQLPKKDYNLLIYRSLIKAKVTGKIQKIT